jgi:hypothetical protein
MLLERLLDTSANSTVGSNSTFDPENVNLVTADPTAVICYLTLGQNQYSGGLGVRISALFVILIVSTAATFFPVLAATKPSLRIPVYVYLFARFFGAGVIVATAFIQYVFFSIISPSRSCIPSLLVLMPCPLTQAPVSSTPRTAKSAPRPA